jgi:hypothetical protein
LPRSVYTRRSCRVATAGRDADERHDIGLLLPILSSHFDIGSPRTWPESVQPQPLGRRDALGRGVRGCLSSWPSSCAWARAWIMDPWLHGSVDPRPTGHRPPGETSWKPGGVHAASAQACTHSISRATTLRLQAFPFPSPFCRLGAGGGSEGPRIIIACVRVLAEVLSLQWWRVRDVRYRVVLLDRDGICLFICGSARLRRSILSIDTLVQSDPVYYYVQYLVKHLAQRG